MVWVVFIPPLISSSWLFQVLRLYLVLLSDSCSTVFQVSGKFNIFVQLFSFHLHTLRSSGTTKATLCDGLFYYFFFFFFRVFQDFSVSRADGFSQEFEWQQVVSSLQDSSQYSGLSQQCSSLDSLHSSSYFQVLQSLYQSFGNCNKSTNYNWYNRHFHVSQFFLIP